ncbi:MAG: hypothetical protein JST48_11440 [Bacteroidetes bacterium]|nr:hypothetical protein [Bacteroidota bacterium]
MKKQYLLILLFVAWCIGSTWWYLFGIKGVKTDPAFFSPQATLISIIEILAMLLIACLLGFGIAWWIQHDSAEEQIENIDRLTTENSVLNKTGSELKSQSEYWREKHKQDMAASQQKLNQSNLITDGLRQQILELEASIVSAKQESLAGQSRTSQSETELGSLRYRIRQLEFQHKEQSELNERLKKENEHLQTKHDRATHSDHPFVRPIEHDDKDDLTKIKGIGPFIEKRLNMIGIYTFQQLGELTPELIDRVGAAIEFFPQRIVRDDWVGQAQTFATK